MDKSALATAFLFLIGFELTMAGMGVRWYYRFGVPIFHRTFPVPRIPDLPPKALAEAYENIFKESVVFVSISENEIGFREYYRFNDFKWRLIAYTPMMRGLIRIDRESKQVSVTCYPNWFVLILTAIIAWNGITGWAVYIKEWQGTAIFIGFLLFLFWIQHCRFTSICWFLKDKKY